MKHIYLNLKRFDIPKEYGGVNSIAGPSEWGEYIVKNTQEALKRYNKEETKFGIVLSFTKQLTQINQHIFL